MDNEDYRHNKLQAEQQRLYIILTSEVVGVASGLALAPCAVQAGLSYLASEQWVEALRFLLSTKELFSVLGAGAEWGLRAGREHSSDAASELGPTSEERRDRFLHSMHLSDMQQSQHFIYPQVFWTSSSAVSSSDCAPTRLCPNGTVPHQDICLPLPERKKQRHNNRDGTRLCFLVVVLLTLLALTGVGLAMFQIYHLQQELDALRELSTSGHVPQSPEMLKGFLNGSAEKKVKRRAHLTGKANQQSLPLEWESTYGHAFISGVQYENRGLVIDEAGLYFVYSKVFFRGRACTAQPLNHVIFKRNPAYPDIQVLMEDQKMNYCMTMHMWGKSSYLGALFNLSRQDSVYVSVSEVKLVNFEESKTFFGLYML
ncbi:LOW QUALITY PROTEIN: tumor necrosis factor ligand superfamily member 6 [Elgaria multicarinata webbii]|uniref:LOW QUALITY PROTEIN: tumor necrosis factor ligand superfamily member 6 n=1 Tax=Elgaria multicarinata webbii TaxID=159646 RepID=UPI002FCCE499